MTDTTNNTVDAAEIDADTEAGHEQAIGSLEHLDPHALQIGENVRDAVDLDKELLASLRQHDVLVPITAVRSDVDGRILVRNGQRRTLGAREVGLSSVPVYVLPATASDETAEAVERIVHQIVTNDQKADLTDAQVPAVPPSHLRWPSRGPASSPTRYLPARRQRPSSSDTR